MSQHNKRQVNFFCITISYSSLPLTDLCKHVTPHPFGSVSLMHAHRAGYCRQTGTSTLSAWLICRDAEMYIHSVPVLVVHADTCEALLSHRAQLYPRLCFSYTAVGVLGTAAQFSVAQRCMFLFRAASLLHTYLYVLMPVIIYLLLSIWGLHLRHFKI